LVQVDTGTKLSQRKLPNVRLINKVQIVAKDAEVLSVSKCQGLN